MLKTLPLNNINDFVISRDQTIFRSQVKINQFYVFNNCSLWH